MSEGSSATDRDTKQTPISDKVIVMEKEFKNRKAHQGKITCLRKISDTEFMTSSDDQSFKVWDKDLQGCSYTYETHEPLYNMRITGEKKDLLISSLGEGNFLVLGLTMRNQNDIIQDAHDTRIVQIVTLDKLKNKYFATRCTDGDLSIWSANPHPDRVFTIDNIDADENQSNVQDTIRESAVEEEPPKNQEIQEEQQEDAKEEEQEAAEGEEDAESEYDDDGNKIEKKKKPEPVVVKKDKGIRHSSDRD